MRVLRRVGAFWYDFVVGDDWRVAIGVVVALGVTYALAHDGIDPWWLLPLAIVVVLGTSIRRAVAVARPAEATDPSDPADPTGAQEPSR